MTYVGKRQTDLCFRPVLLVFWPVSDLTSSRKTASGQLFVHIEDGFGSAFSVLAAPAKIATSNTTDIWMNITRAVGASNVTNNK